MCGYCHSEGGTPFITLTDRGAGGYFDLDARSGELVSGVAVSDVAEWCSDTQPPKWLVLSRFIPDCLWVRDRGGALRAAVPGQPAGVRKL